MKVTVELDAAGYPNKDAISAKGFILRIGEYSSDHTSTIKINFAEGMELLQGLVAAAKEHHQAVTDQIVKTGQLASIGDAIASVDNAPF